MTTVPGPGSRTCMSAGNAQIAAAAAQFIQGFFVGGAATLDRGPVSESYTAESFCTSTEVHLGQQTLMAANVW